ncbi:hypothetical protein DFH08DRAFT_1085490 [Mycena albidolilacea]|uniref:Uncharacterized protein n=1 Tax=Mycena albidolilacea TaxID=1033008 RepID=A0AAD6ZHU8_9AGAR|nr:hypothetical protein DFH08DRAFT_1085490 [Mycena albidolilacea]
MPLLCYSPEDIWGEEDDECLRRPVVPANWERFLVYPSRIRAFEYNDRPHGKGLLIDHNTAYACSINTTTDPGHTSITFSVTPDTSLWSVLERVCQKTKLETTECGLASFSDVTLAPLDMDATVADLKSGDHSLILLTPARFVDGIVIGRVVTSVASSHTVVE